jgi:ribosomal protection tetracycline resistance protein
MAFLNLGILAHVDAGKTSLTERILLETGVIKTAGRVDHGNTQTDTLELERARGITIRAAVVAFPLGGRTVNLIDTPGHADFIAEVQRSLLVLDAVVLVVSAVEGIQPQTRKLARAVRSLGLPLIVFINKIDRLGARVDPLFDDIRTVLHLPILPMVRAHAIGDIAPVVAPIPADNPDWQEQAADLLATNSDHFLAEWLEPDHRAPEELIADELPHQVAAAQVVPVYAGSATRGIGVDLLLAGIAELFPDAPCDPGPPLAATVFKIDRLPGGEKVVYARLVTGELSNRSRVRIVSPDSESTEAIEERIKGIDGYRLGGPVPVQQAAAGEIVRLHGLSAVRIGDAIGSRPAIGNRAANFAEPRLESIVRPRDPAESNRLHLALQVLAESDPLINVRLNDLTGERSVRLFGEIQQEVIRDMLLSDFGLRVTFGETAPICIERLAGSGSALMRMDDLDNPFVATIGLTIEPGPIGSGICHQRDLGSLPLAYYRVLEEAIYGTLEEGLAGWQVTDCQITLGEVGYSAPVSNGTDFRRLTPMIVMRALDQAGTTVCEPIESFEVITPLDALGDVVQILIAGRATPLATDADGDMAVITGTVPTGCVHGIERRIYGVGRGMTSLTNEFRCYEPVSGEPPARVRRTINPLHQAEYLAQFGSIRS